MTFLWLAPISSWANEVSFYADLNTYAEYAIGIFGPYKRVENIKKPQSNSIPTYIGEFAGFSHSEVRESDPFIDHRFSNSNTAIVAGQWNEAAGEMSVYTDTSAYAQAGTGTAIASLDVASSVSATANLSFAERSWVRVWYDLGAIGGSYVYEPGRGPFPTVLQGTGVMDFYNGTGYGLGLNFGTGRGGRLTVDGYAETTTPSFDYLRVSDTAYLAWAVAKLDEDLPLAPELPTRPVQIYSSGLFGPDGSEELPKGLRPTYISKDRPTIFSTMTEFLVGEFKRGRAKSYSFNTGDIAITSLLVPASVVDSERLVTFTEEGPTADTGSALIATFGGQSHAIIPGQRIEFGPEGIHEFTISGFDPTMASSSLDAFQFELQFAGTGFTTIEARAVDFQIVPEASTIVMLSISCAAFAIRRRWIDCPGSVTSPRR